MFFSFVPRRSETSFWDTTLRHPAEAHVDRLEALVLRVLDSYITPLELGQIGDDPVVVFKVLMPNLGTAVVSTLQVARSMILSAIEGS